MNAEEATGLHRGVPSPARPEIRVVVHGGSRFPASRLDSVLVDPPAPPSLEAVRGCLASVRDRSVDGVWLWGGEPTLRGDLPRLLSSLGEIEGVRKGLISDGQALTSVKVVEQIRQMGVGSIRLVIASVRASAQDWYLGGQGSFKRSLLAARAIRKAGVELEVEVPVTRPTRPFVREVVELAARLGARRVWLRRVTGRGLARTRDVEVLARLGLLQADVEQAVQLGAREGLQVVTEGFPRCVLPGVVAHSVSPAGVEVLVPPDGPWRFLSTEFASQTGDRGCAGCPGPSGCVGAPEDYVRRFGRSEIDAHTNPVRQVGDLPRTPAMDGSRYPPPRAGRFPSASLPYVARAARLTSLADDPLVMVPRPAVPARVRAVFLAPAKIADPVLGDQPGPQVPETTRQARIRLVQVAQHGARTLRIASAGSMNHPDAPELLREAVRLQFEQVEVAGEISALASMKDLKMRRLRGLTRLDAALFGATPEVHDAVVGDPGAFEATLDLLDRASRLVPGLAVGAYAVIRAAREVEPFAQAWADGRLPGDPWFRLAPSGGSLHELADVARGLGEGPARDALAAVLPVSLLERGSEVVPAPAAQEAWGSLAADFARPSGSDRYGCYADRLADAFDPQPGDCPGYAVGWNR